MTSYQQLLQDLKCNHFTSMSFAVQCDKLRKAKFFLENETTPKADKRQIKTYLEALQMILSENTIASKITDVLESLKR